MQACQDIEGYLRATRRKGLLILVACFCLPLLILTGVPRLPAPFLALYPADLLMVCLVLVWGAFVVAVSLVLSGLLPKVASTDDTVACLRVVRHSPVLMEEFSAVYLAQGQRMLNSQLEHFEHRARASMLDAVTD